MAEPVALLILGLTVLILGSVSLAVMIEAAGRRDRLAERLAEHRRRKTGELGIGSWGSGKGRFRFSSPPSSRCPVPRRLRRDWAERPGGTRC